MTDQTSAPASYNPALEAVALGKQSVVEPGRRRPPPRVGAVLVDANGLEIGRAYRGESGPGDHAEYALLERKLSGVDLTGSTLYTTLEPCTERGEGKIPCAERVISRGIAAVHIGMYDPHPTVYRRGWKQLNDAGIDVVDFAHHHHREVQHDNTEFVDALRLTVGNTGEVEFDYTLNGGDHVVRDGETEFHTHWTSRGADSIYALDYENNVAEARHASTINGVGDPRALDFTNYTVGVAVGEIVVFRSAGQYLLVQIKEVLNVDRGAKYNRLKFEYLVKNSI